METEQQIPPTCGECPSWVKKINLEDIKNIAGECRALPPTIVATPMQTNQGMGLSIQTMFPMVSEKGCCGLHPEIVIVRELEKIDRVQAFMAELAGVDPNAEAPE